MQSFQRHAFWCDFCVCEFALLFFFFFGQGSFLFYSGDFLACLVSSSICQIKQLLCFVLVAYFDTKNQKTPKNIIPVLY